MVAAVRKAHSPKMIIMALSTKYKARQTVDKEVRSQVKATFKTNMFDAWIPDAAAVNQATGIGKSVYETNIASPAAMSFFNLANEIRERFGDEKVGLDGISTESTESRRATIEER